MRLLIANVSSFQQYTPRRNRATGCTAKRGGTYSLARSREFEKSQAMLEHFMRMVVDEGTRMLDPTCGSGSALRAADRLGAREVLGLERDEVGVGLPDA